MAKQFFWKIWLKPNLLTKDIANDYVAEVSTTQTTARNEDIAMKIVKTRSELRYETILSILSERDAVVRDCLLEGYSVQDGNIHLTPRILGNWIGPTPIFNPSEHKVTVNATLTAAMRKTLAEEVGVEVLGKQTDGGAGIWLVTDIRTGYVNGEVSTGGDIIIEGEKIKIAPEDDPKVGVFFVNTAGTAIPLDDSITTNTPKKIICRVPAQVHNGRFTLKIVTRYASGGKLLLKARTLVYELPITEGVVPN
jgi:hypothetical protein